MLQSNLIRWPLGLAVLLILMMPGFAQAQSATPVWAGPGPHAVRVETDDWVDAARDRSLPVKLYRPDGDGPFPVVIFSHGLGGSREAAPYLGEHWASWGYLGVFIQHPGSDEAVWARQPLRARSALIRAARDPDVARSRYSDIPFIIDAITARANVLDADPERIAIAGHSFGAHTVLAALGQDFFGQPAFLDPRLRAGIALSPPAPPARVPEARHADLYDAISTPILHFTGTQDTHPLNPDLPAETRTLPYQLIDGAPQYLVVFEGGDHAVFGGRGPTRRQPVIPETYPEIQALTAMVSTVFLEAWVKDDPDAMAWLNDDALASAFRPGDRVEHR